MSRLFAILAVFLVLPAIPAMEGPSGSRAVDEHEAWTLTAMHRLQEALESYENAHGRYPVAGPAPVEVDALRPELEPDHLDSMPVEDGWEAVLRYWSDGTHYAIVSHGPDGEAGGSYGTLPEVRESGDDLILIDGHFRHGPDHLIQLLELGSQKRTMADIRSIAICFESYFLDNDEYPVAPASGWVEVETIRDRLQPVYIRTLPILDAWGNPFWVWSDGERYRIVSDGRDGKREADYAVVSPTAASSSFDADIVMGDGQFLQWPEGPQR